VRGCRN